MVSDIKSKLEMMCWILLVLQEESNTLVSTMETLIELREAHWHASRTSTGIPIAVGDLVVVHTENQPIGHWTLAKVEQTIVGQHWKIRGAILKVSSN